MGEDYGSESMILADDDARRLEASLADLLKQSLGGYNSRAR
jgi:hypothetical protein